jgi:hypothetical protein
MAWSLAVPDLVLRTSNSVTSGESGMGRAQHYRQLRVMFIAKAKGTPMATPRKP